MNIECAVSVGCPGGPGDMVTAVVTATPDVFGGKMPWTLGDSGPPWSEPGTGAGGDHSPGVRPVCVSGQEHAHRVQCCSDHAECASRGARALSLPGHSPERVSWRSACHRSVTLRDWVRDSCVTSHDSVTSHHCYCHHYLCLLCHSCCQGSLPISELVLS